MFRRLKFIWTNDSGGHSVEFNNYQVVSGVRSSLNIKPLKHIAANQSWEQENQFYTCQFTLTTTRWRWYTVLRVRWSLGTAHSPQPLMEPAIYKLQLSVVRSSSSSSSFSSAFTHSETSRTECILNVLAPRELESSSLAVSAKPAELCSVGDWGEHIDKEWGEGDGSGGGEASVIVK